MYRIISTGSGMLALIPTVVAATPFEKEPQKPPPMKPSELPVYESPHADYVEHLQEQKTKQSASYVHSVLQEPVRTVRQFVQNILSQTDSVRLTITDNVHEFQDKTDWIVKYLREEENKEVRYGAVGMGGLTGFIFGLRGGFIRRLFYASVGTTLMGAVCFPEETKELADQNVTLAKQYINIAYNFLYGDLFFTECARPGEAEKHPVPNPMST